MIFWNVAGLKGKEADFWNFIKEFEVIVFTETWIEEKEEAIARSKLEEDYDVEMMAASKEAGKGRSKGGLILATKKGFYEEVPNARRWKGKEFIGKELRRQGKRSFVGVTYMRQQERKQRIDGNHGTCKK